MLIIKLLILNIINFIMRKVMPHENIVRYPRDRNYWGNVINTSIFSPGNASFFHVYDKFLIS